MNLFTWWQEAHLEACILKKIFLVTPPSLNFKIRVNGDQLRPSGSPSIFLFGCFWSEKVIIAPLEEQKDYSEATVPNSQNY